MKRLEVRASLEHTILSPNSLTVILSVSVSVHPDSKKQKVQPQRVRIKGTVTMPELSLTGSADAPYSLTEEFDMTVLVSQKRDGDGDVNVDGEMHTNIFLEGSRRCAFMFHPLPFWMSRASPPLTWVLSVSVDPVGNEHADNPSSSSSSSSSASSSAFSGNAESSRGRRVEKRGQAVPEACWRGAHEAFLCERHFEHLALLAERGRDRECGGEQEQEPIFETRTTRMERWVGTATASIGEGDKNADEKGTSMEEDTEKMAMKILCRPLDRTVKVFAHWKRDWFQSSGDKRPSFLPAVLRRGLFMLPSEGDSGDGFSFGRQRQTKEAMHPCPAMRFCIPLSDRMRRLFDRYREKRKRGEEEREKEERRQRTPARSGKKAARIANEFPEEWWCPLFDASADGEGASSSSSSSVSFSDSAVCGNGRRGQAEGGAAPHDSAETGMVPEDDRRMDETTEEEKKEKKGRGAAPQSGSMEEGGSSRWRRNKKLRKVGPSLRMTVNCRVKEALERAKEYHQADKGGTWLNEQLIDRLTEMSAESGGERRDGLQVLIFELWEPGRGGEGAGDGGKPELVAASCGYKVGSVFHDFTFMTLKKDGRSLGGCLTRAVGECLERCGYDLWYWGFQLPYMQEYCAYGAEEICAPLFYECLREGLLRGEGEGGGVRDVSAFVKGGQAAIPPLEGWS
uniref:Uncharacterized protein n=1 Tax=Chromera velia CCMP2878 TaxID=1169474 RepID=A0A0G4HL77_9ALVE|eukprot:Cvel_7397.t1-p1 / transcript=Cvel_7397.t1 / gene=Cvel_7397 / organism=Chromera_velia_CCMP2878 / gene_product=hypothetical protein / transcript_product=hypothetical protein / location=Cvel_scaffold385:80366-84190(-) / protein_length=680 / sequence_SO=supercontig / SO=protein_coding / is_pseudo=false